MNTSKQIPKPESTAIPPRKATNRARVADLLCQISDPEEMAAALECILTYKEFQEVENRLQIFKLLDQKIPQREISASLGVGIATVTRGAQAYRKGKFETLKRYLSSKP